MSRNFELLTRLNSEDWGAASEDDHKRDIRTPDFPIRSVQGRTHTELHKLVQRLFLSGKKPLRRVLFTGAERGVGCTRVTLYTSEVLCSQTADSICLVDAAMNSSAIRAHFSLADGPPFGDRSAGSGAAHNFARQVRRNLWVITAGGDHVGDLMPLRARLEACLLEVCEQFDYVLVDAPPVGNGSSSITLASVVNGAVLVLKAGHTRRSTVHLAIADLGAAGVTVLGTILNQRDYPIPEAIYRRI